MFCIYVCSVTWRNKWQIRLNRKRKVDNDTRICDIRHISKKMFVSIGMFEITLDFKPPQEMQKTASCLA